jgi:hypothetical protein
MIEHQASMGELLRKELTATGWQLKNETPFPLVCFTREGLDVPQLIKAVHQRQIAWVSEAKIGGVPVVRACVTSFKTTEGDIRWIVAEMNKLV